MFTKYLNYYKKLTLNFRGVALCHNKNHGSSLVSSRNVSTSTVPLPDNHIKSHQTLSYQDVWCRSQTSLNKIHSGSLKLMEVSNMFSKVNFSSSISNVRFVSTQSKEVESEHSGSQKAFVEVENSKLFQIILSIPELKATLAPKFKSVDDLISDDEFNTLMKTDLSNVDKSEILEIFKKITYYMYDKEDSLSHTSFDNMCNALTNSMEHFSDDELCKLLFLLQVWSPKCFRKERNYFNIFCAIDKVQLQRLSKKGVDSYNLHQLLLMLDFWSQLNLLKSSNFCKVALKKLLNKCHQLGPKQFVQLMFYHCRYRTFHPVVNIYNVEFHFEQIYDELSPSEITIVLLAFFKSEKLFSGKNICLKIAKTFINHAEELDSIYANGYLKSMKFHFPFKHADVLYEVCNKLLEVIDSFDYHILPHAAVLGTKLDVYHPELVDKIIEIANKNIEMLRIKDLEKVLFPIAIYNHKVKEPEFLDKVINEFLSEKREKEINHHPKSLISLVHHLTVLKHYNSDLIGKCLDIENLESWFGKRLSGYILPKDLLFVDFSTEIEYPDYTGPRLPEDLKHKLCKHYAWRKPGDLFHNKEIKSDMMSITVREKLEQILGGEKYVHLAYVLPHFIKPDLLVCLKDGKPVPIPQSMADFVYMSAYPPPAKGKWFAIVFLTLSQFVNPASNTYKGPCECKIRQLKLLGYEPIVISPYMWKDETDQAREQILRDKLKGYLEIPGDSAQSVEAAKH